MDSVPGLARRVSWVCRETGLSPPETRRTALLHVWVFHSNRKKLPPPAGEIEGRFAVIWMSAGGKVVAMDHGELPR